MVEALKLDSLARRGVIVIALFMSFRTFQFFPGMQYVQEAWFLLCFLFILFAYPLWKIRIGLRFSRFEFYLLILTFAGIALAAWRAQQVFVQPLIYGIISQRAIVLIAAPLILFNAMRYRNIQPKNIEAALLFLTWGTFLLFSAMRLFLDPTRFVSYGVGFVVTSELETSFKFPSYFIIFGVFYYAMLGLRTRRVRYYFAALILFPAALGPSGRGLTVCVAATLLLCLYRLRGLRRTLITAAKFGFVLAILVGGLYAVAPQKLSTRAAGFADVFTVLSKGSLTTDNSANARIFETLTALPYIEEHPWLGNGVISHQWEGGSKGALGAYFYAADIGVIGVIFSFGILGLALFAYQYRFAWRAAKKLPSSYYSPLLDATKAMVVYTALYSIAGGLCVWYPEVTLFFIALLYGIASQAKPLSVFDIRTEIICRTQKPVLSA